jgi:stress response protein YsnF
MSRTVTALYDTRAEAEAARQRLAAEVQLASARIFDQQSHASGQSDGSLNRLPLSQEDRSTYHEGIRRGGFLLTAEVTGHEDADKIVRLLEEGTSVDLDRRQEQWRSDGWTPSQAGSSQARSSQAPSSQAGQRSGGSGSEQVIPVVEEELVVGRREVERGGARVRSYVREVPVHEEVTLREEHVNVERRPMDRPLGAAELDGDLLRERDVEVTAHGEEAIVSKEARVREQVVVSKTEERRTQQIEDQVARTEVVVEEGRSGQLPAHDQTGSSRVAPAGPTSFGGGGHAAVAPPPVPEQYAVEDIRPDRAARVETVVTERRQTSRPSTALVIGSAVAGAIAGGVLPFMLVGRKTSRRSETLLIEDHSPSPATGHPTRDFVRGGRRY